MDLDQLQSVRDRERGTDDLQELRESFYAEATEFVNDLRAEREAAAAEATDPFDSPRVTRLTDRIRTAEQTLEAIYEKRVGKVVKAATFAAADLPAEAEGMTAEEAELFETLVAEIQANREQVLGKLAEAEEPLGEAAADAAADEDDDAPAVQPTEGPEEGGESGPPPGPEQPSDDGASGPPAGSDEADGEGNAGGSGAAEEGGAVPEAAAEAADVERERVLITDDVGAILGVDDREYDLAADDVVTLPAANAEPLIEQGVAERLE